MYVIFKQKNTIYENKCLETIKILFKQASKCDDQQQLKDIIEDAMVFIPGILTDNSAVSPMTSTPINKPLAQKSLCLFTNILDVKKN